MILTEKQQKSQHYNQEKLINMNILPSNQEQIIEKGKFVYSPLGKAFEEQTENYVGVIKSLELYTKKMN